MSRRVNQIAVKEKQSQVTVENQIHQVSTDKVIRHNLNVGPPGPPGSGLQITGVVNTASELPPNAVPGDAYLIAETNTVSAWVAGAWWNLGGPMQGPVGPQGPQGPQGPEGPEGPQGEQGPAPKINDLPARPGGPQPTDEFWLASAGGAADFKATIAALASAVFGNISVVKNSDGTSIRIPSIRLQICYGVTEPQEITISHGGGLRTGTHTHAFPQNFSGTPVVIGGVRNVAGNAVSCYTAGTGGGSFLYRLYALESGTGSVAFVAWGDY